MKDTPIMAYPRMVYVCMHAYYSMYRACE